MAGNWSVKGGGEGVAGKRSVEGGGGGVAGLC